MSKVLLARICDLIQEDIGSRGLRTDPDENLVTVCAGDFAAACRSIAEHPDAAVGIVTGFYIPHAQPPCGETDGPLGAVFLARALVPLGIKVVVLTDPFCVGAIQAGLAVAGLRKQVPLVPLPTEEELEQMAAQFEWVHQQEPGVTVPLRGDSHAEFYWKIVSQQTGRLTHLVALERVGPSHTPESLRSQGAAPADLALFAEAVAAEHHDRCHTMRGRDITAHMSPVHLLFEATARQEAGITTIGIGDGGNEIGMGKVPWRVVHRNVPGGGAVACRVPVDHLIVCGISNWGAYGLAAGVRLLRGQVDGDLFDLNRERELLECMVQRGPLVDGVTGEEAATVDGQSFERYAEPLRQLATLTARRRPLATWPTPPAPPSAGAPAPANCAPTPAAWPSATCRRTSSSCRASWRSTSCCSASATRNRVRCST